MIVVLGLKSCDSGDGIKLTLELDGEKNTYTVGVDFYIECGILKGEISEELFDEIVEESRLYGAKRSAIRMLTSAQCSKKRLMQKLMARGFNYECAKNATDFAAQKGYIDEGWQIENYLKTLVEKKYFGRRKVIPALLAKGYNAGEINRILDEKYTDADFKKWRTEFLISKFGKSKPDTSEEALEMKKALYKQGY